MSLQTSLKVRGSIAQAQKKLQQDNLFGAIVNQKMQGKFELLPVADIIPLESQRDVAVNWALSRLKECNGFDVAAAPPINCVRTPDKKVYVWDGLGRLTMAEIVGKSTIDCWVFEGTQEDAAKYFVYNQKKGKRNLNGEQIFCNIAFSKDSEALDVVNNLITLKLSIHGAQDVIQPTGSTDPRIKAKAYYDSMKIADNDITIVKKARDFIMSAYPTTDIIPKELLCGITHLFTNNEDAGKNGAFTALNQYVSHKAVELDVKELARLFKLAGGNQHNDEARSVAIGLCKEFQASNFCGTAYLRSKTSVSLI